jgi:hypothetical protein
MLSLFKVFPEPQGDIHLYLFSVEMKLSSNPGLHTKQESEESQVLQFSPQFIHFLVTGCIYVPDGHVVFDEHILLMSKRGDLQVIQLFGLLISHLSQSITLQFSQYLPTFV